MVVDNGGSDGSGGNGSGGEFVGFGVLHALHARAVQELYKLQIISAFVDSRLESIEQFLNNFTNNPNETYVNNFESDDESVETPLVSPFPHSDNDSDNGEVLNELIEYENVGMLRRERTINSCDGDDLAFQCMIGFRKFVAYFDPFLPINIIKRKAYNTIMVEGLESTGKNLVVVVRDVYVFVGSFTYITDFVEKPAGPNFTNWYQNLRIVLSSEGKQAHLEQPLIHLPYPVASQAACDAYKALYDAQNEVACLMLGGMSPELQRGLENYKAYYMIQELKSMFEEQAKQELLETVTTFYACKQEGGQSLSSYLLKMKSYLDILECLGYVMPNRLGVSLILNSLNKDYD
nr:zinc finger, CCHC-type [Tanacetum cinerariifolium]